MRLFRLVLALPFALTIGVSVAQPVDQRLVGRWHGQAMTDDGVHCWVSERRADGSFTTEFIAQDGREFHGYTQQGTWSASGTRFTTVIRAVDGDAVPPERIDYRLLDVRADAIVYVHAETGDEFRVRRVSAAFRLPPKCGQSDA